MVSRTSRKKSKGRDRKAKKEASKAETERVRARELWLGWALGNERITGVPMTCDHGLGLDLVSVELDHPVTSFLDELFTGDNVGQFDNIIFQTPPQLLNDERLKKKTIDILTSMGTNLLSKTINLHEIREDILSLTAWSMCIARAIIILEHHNVNDRLEEVFLSRKVAIKRRDLDIHENVSSSHRRDLLKFFSKRISCSCLKQQHQKARETIPKMGSCHVCSVRKERVDLWVCSRCMISQYCSRECQVAHWREHKEDCDQFVSVHEQQTQIVDEKDKEKTE